MALTLELRDNCLAHPLRVDLAVIEAMMLWPDDEQGRDRAMEAAAAQFGREAMQTGVLSGQQIAELAALAVDAPAPADVNRAAQSRFIHGSTAGKILRYAVSYAKGGAPVSIGNIMKALAREKDHLTAKTIENTVWPRFRPVAHLWTAYLQGIVDGDETFPCRVRNLGQFLGLAEAFRRLAENTRTPRSPRSLLLPGEAVQLPDTIEVPAVDLDFEMIRRN